MHSVCVSAVCGVHDDAVCPAASQEKREEEEREERRREKRRAANQQKQKNKREREQSERSEHKNKQKKQKNSGGAIAPCVAVSEAFKWRRSAASVGNVHTNGITPALVSP